MKDSFEAYGLGNRSTRNYRPGARASCSPPLPSAATRRGQLVRSQQTEEPLTAQTLPSRSAGGWDPLPFIQLPRHFVDRTQVI